MKTTSIRLRFLMTIALMVNMLSVCAQDLTSLIVNNDFDPAKGCKDEKRIDGWGG